MAGLARETNAGIVNEAWLFTPTGEQSAAFRKHIMAPPERDYLPGHDYAVGEIGGARYGIGICKDLHFATFGRAYGQQGAAVMMVPAWDFGVDAWMAARMKRYAGSRMGTWRCARTAR